MMRKAATEPTRGVSAKAADGLLHYFQFHILTLQTGVVLHTLYQLGDGLYVLVVGKHVEVLMKQTLARLVQRIVLLALASPG